MAAESAPPLKPRNFRAPDVLWDQFVAECATEGAGPAEILREFMRFYARGGRVGIDSHASADA